METIKELERYHERTLSDQAMADYTSVLENYGNLDAAVKEWKYKHSPADKFPSISDLCGLCFDLRVQGWNKLKKSEPTVDDLERNVKSIHGKTALREMREHLNWNPNDPKDKERGRRDYIAWMRSMEKRFPYKGWSEEADDLEKFYATERERYAKSYSVRRFMATHGNPPRPWMLYDWEVQNETAGTIVTHGPFAQLNRDFTVRDLRCIGCGLVFRLPFANGNEQTVLCEDCNRKERTRR